MGTPMLQSLVAASPFLRNATDLQGNPLYEGDKNSQANSSAQTEEPTSTPAQTSGAPSGPNTLSTNDGRVKQAQAKAAVETASQAGRAGATGTMLTGGQGVDPNTLQLGRTTLLGG